MISLRISPAIIACRCSLIASMCTPSRKGVAGSISCQPERTKCGNERRARSASISAGVGIFSIAIDLLQQCELCLAESGEVESGRLGGLDRAAVLSDQLIACLPAPARGVPALQVAERRAPVLAHRPAEDGDRMHLRLRLGQPHR